MSKPFLIAAGKLGEDGKAPKPQEQPEQNVTGINVENMTDKQPNNADGEKIMRDFGNSCFANMIIRFLVGIGRTASTETNHEKWSASISARNAGNSNGHTLTEIRREKIYFG